MTEGRTVAPARRGEGFRPDLEGLRAVAVVLVLLFHARIPGFAGGFVGVDVFFVLSGFLITGLLTRELAATRTVSLPDFYARRARRLLPAAALVLLATVLASIVLLPPLRLPDVTGDAAAASLYVSNMRFAFQATDYLQSALPPSPVLHFWSLGVEEQFYVFWPALVLLVGRGATTAAGAAQRVGRTALVVSLVSFALAVWLTGANGPWAFFSLPTRAWELGIGAVLAVRIDALRSIPERIATAMGWLGLALVVAGGMLITGDMPFPGVVALVPTIGSALVIAGGPAAGSQAVGRFLGTAVPRFLGRISYSLYLWHWPLLVLPEAALDHELRLWQRLALVGVAIVLATASQRWVENPIRHGRFVGTRARRNLAMAGALSVVVAGVSLGIGGAATAALAATGPANTAADQAALDRALGGALSPAPGSAQASASPQASKPASPAASPRPSRKPGASASAGPSASTTPASTAPGSTASASAGPSASTAPASAAPTATPGATQGAPATPAPTLAPTVDEPVPADLTPSIGAARADLPDPYNDGCHLDAVSTVSPACTYGVPNGSKTVVLYGDSHALSWWPAVQALARKFGWRFVSLTKSACSAADVRQYNGSLKRVYTECTAWRANSLARIASEHPDLVIVSGDRSLAIVDGAGNRLAGAAMLAAWETGQARTLAALTAIPGVQVAVIGDTPHPSVDVPVCLSAHRDSILACATPLAKAIDPAWSAAEAALAGNAGVTFVNPIPWVCPTDPCPPVIAGFLVFRDDHHLTRTFATALASRLGAALPGVGP